MAPESLLRSDIDGIRKDMAIHETADVLRFSEINLKLAGIGSDGTPLALRLDRLEQNGKRWGRIGYLILAAIIALLVERISDRMYPPQAAADPVARQGSSRN